VTLIGRYTSSKECYVGEHVQYVHSGQSSRCVDLESSDRVLRQQLLIPVLKWLWGEQTTYLDFVYHVEGIVVAAI
jgi:hypothetical protein